MQRKRWRYRSALAAFIPAMLFVSIGAEATPPSSLTPHTIVATAQEIDCGSWFFYPCWDYGLQLTATEGVGGTALLSYDGYESTDLTAVRITLTCLSFEQSGDLIGGSNHTFRASGIAEDGTKHYFVAEDGYDYLAVTRPGQEACGTDEYGWYYYRPDVVIAP